MTESPRKYVRVIDSHTGGEPTRVVIEGGPDLGDGPLSERRELFRDRFDEFRSAVVNEPRGSDVWVGALLCKPTDVQCAAGVIFFNNVGPLKMCGHGLIGLVVTLAYLGRISRGFHQIETPVGLVGVELRDDHTVSFRNVPSFRHATDVALEVEGLGMVTGDVAWGGNWFFITDDHAQRIDRANIRRLTDVSWRIRRALERDNVTGAAGAVIDHIELLAPSSNPAADSRNFVLCPGGAYDRSPCGTGTSAKLACLYAAGKLAPGRVWRQQGIMGSIFEGSVETEGDQIIPHIMGSAYVTAEATLVFDPDDPFRMGIRP